MIADGMSPLERAAAREAQRYSANILDPVMINSINDIKKVLTDFDPNKNQQQKEIPVSAQFAVDGKVYMATTKTKSKSRRDILVEGLELIKNRIESKVDSESEPIIVNGKELKQIKLSNGSEGHNWIDPLIKQWLGGYRRGTDIFWDLNDGCKYKYNVFEHKLMRIMTDES
jgi:hypothetical protein